MAFTPPKPRRRTSAVHSTSNLVHPIDGTNETDFDSSHSAQIKAPVPSSENERRKLEDESSSSSYQYPDHQLSQADKHNPARRSLDGQCDDPKNDITPGPGAYTPELAARVVYRSSPAFTIARRNAYPPLFEYNTGPGPVYHVSASDAVCKQRAPAYTLTDRRPVKYASRLIIGRKE